MRPRRSLRRQAVAILAAFTVLDVLGIAAAYGTQVRLSNSSQQAFSERDIQSDLQRLELGMANQEAGLNGFAATGLAGFLKRYRLGQSQVADAERKLDGAETDAAGRRSYQAVKQAATDWQTWADGYVAAVVAGGVAAGGPDAAQEGERRFASFQQAADSFELKVQGEANTAQRAATRRSDFLIVYLPAIAGLGLLVLLALSFVFFRRTLSPIGKLIDAASALTRGESVLIPGSDRHDEVGHLAQALQAWERSSGERLSLAQAMNEVTGDVDLGSVLELGVRRLREVLRSSEVVISLGGLAGAEIVAADPHPFGQGVLPSASPGMEAIRLQQPVFADLRDEKWDQSVHDWQGPLRLGPAMSVPMISGGQVIGVATSIREVGELDFGPEDARLAQLIVPPLAAAVHVCSLFAELSQANSDLQRASQVKSQFLAGMSHELRTPLNAILGFSELLLESPDGGFDEAARTKFLQTIHKSGKHLLALINDILDLSKIEAGRLELRPEPFEVDEAVEAVVTTVQPLATDKHITLVTETAEAGAIVADLQRVRQILFNLLSNAIKFTPEGGTVLVSARRLSEEVQIAVADSGVGIATSDLERIFERFEQLEASRSAAQPGTGLGLALTRSLVELHEGRIWVESEPGAGSTFTVALPLRTETAEPRTEPSDSVVEQDPSWPLVLVVEDDPEAARLLSHHLARGGYGSEVAFDGQQALIKAKTLRPVAITLDIMLPELDGWEVLRSLKLDEDTRDIPVVVVSVVDSIERGRGLGAVDYLVKPVDRQDLLARLDRHAFATRLRQGEVRALVVDDDPAARELLRGILAGAGYQAATAAGGAEAIGAAQDSPPDLMLLDLMMPEVTGFDVVAALKGDPRTRNIPILIVTARDLSAEEKAELNGRVAAIMTKQSLATVDLLAWLQEIQGLAGVGQT